MNEAPISIGSTHLRCIPLGIGTWSWGDEGQWGFGVSHTEEDLKNAFAESVGHGVTLFDTGERYGNGRSERFLGKFINQSHREIVVATKFSPLQWHVRRQDLTNALLASLKRLGLAKVALYQLHWPSRFISVEKRMDAFAEALEKNLAESVGVSNFNLEQLMRAQESLRRRNLSLATIQLEYNLLQRFPERNGILKACRRLGITFLAYSPLGRGVLTGKYSVQNPLPGTRGRLYPGSLLEKISSLISLLKRIGEVNFGKTPAQVALNWLMCKGAIPLAGAKSGEQAQENMGALGWRLTPEQVLAIDEESLRLQPRSLKR